MKPLLLDQAPEAWDLGEAPAYRRRQIAEWIFGRRVTAFGQMSNLPAALRHDLAARYDLEPLALARRQGSADTTRKYLWALRAGDFVESVLIPANPGIDGDRAGRWTLCVSSQVGCAYGCKFCASGLDGWKRHLTPGEIIGQVLAAEADSGVRVDNLVFMGMGEPLANYAQLMTALDRLNAPSPSGLGIGARHVTISTSGLAPQIRRLADDPRQFRLAISLHGATDPVRERIMPINRRFPLAELLAACEAYQRRKRKMITLEYILIDGINDELTEAHTLVRHARRLHAKVNLIPYNTVEGLEWRRPPRERIRAFAEVLQRAGVTATVRLEKGHDIDAACGQLRLKEKAVA
ncbi:MAG: 23S rRNA (adenine(2503)-C(2))-methyltransferase RlmN [Verrucomicrobiota bacterium]